MTGDQYCLLDIHRGLWLGWLARDWQRLTGLLLRRFAR